MNTPKHSIALAFTAAAYLIGAPLSAATCDKVAADVRAAIEANPSKVLIIVEDAMVTNETCACEIVKTALIASKANADLARQIVLTATNVAPNLTQLIAECARGVLAGDGTTGKTGKEVADVYGKEVQDVYGKEVKNVVGVQPVNDYAPAPADIRGVYLIQPSAGAIVVTKECDCVPHKKSPPPKHHPQSPSNASPKL
jgi:hypothetical protein